MTATVSWWCKVSGSVAVYDAVLRRPRRQLRRRRGVAANIRRHRIVRLRCCTLGVWYRGVRQRIDTRRQERGCRQGMSRHHGGCVAKTVDEVRRRHQTACQITTTVISCISNN